MTRIPRGRALSEAAFAVAIIVMCGAVYWSSLGLPPAMLEPVGPAAFPQAISLILGALALAVLVRALLSPSPVGDSAEIEDRRPGLAALTIGLTILYLGVMQLEWLGYREASILYLFALGAALVDFDRVKMAYVGLIALVLGLGTHFLFTRFFFIDLP